MTDYIASDWIENTGDVPAGVGPDTRLEVEWNDGETQVWDVCQDGIPNNDTYTWSLDEPCIIRFRFLETSAERDARIKRGLTELMDAGRVAEQAGRDGE